jgi:hypothetical protein
MHILFFWNLNGALLDFYNLYVKIDRPDRFFGLIRNTGALKKILPKIFPNASSSMLSIYVKSGSGKKAYFCDRLIYNSTKCSEWWILTSFIWDFVLLKVFISNGVPFFLNLMISKWFKIKTKHNRFRKNRVWF